jgi:putative ATP-binding cassette transporter
LASRWRSDNKEMDRLVPLGKSTRRTRTVTTSIPGGFADRTLLVLVTGSNQAAGTGAVPGDSGCFDIDAGRIVHPGAGEICFLAQRPYLPPGTLRQLLEGDTQPNEASDDRIHSLLRELNLEQIVTQAGGLDVERDWGTLLALNEQQFLALIYVFLAAPQFVFLDRLGAASSSEQLQKMLHMLIGSSITNVCVGAGGEPRDLRRGPGVPGGWRLDMDGECSGA